MATAKRQQADVSQLAKRLASMRQARLEHEPEWTDICRYIAPRKADIKRYTGKPDDTKIWNPVPQHAMEVQAASLGGLITNPATIWFNLTVRYIELEDLPEAREWLEECRDRMLAVFNSDSSGFQQSAGEVYQDAAALANAVIFVAKDGPDIDTGAHLKSMAYTAPRKTWEAENKPKKNGQRTLKFPAPAADTAITFQAIPIWEIFVGGDRNGKPAHIYRVYKMTLQQCWDTWGEKCSDKVKKGYMDDPEQKIEICHAVYPREGTNRRSMRVATNLPFACVYYETESKKLLEESGYHEMPYMFWRWSVLSGQMYGRGQAHIALPFARVLNAMSETTLMAAEKVSDPPLLVPDDSFLGPIRSGPGGLSYYRSGSQDRIEALPITADLSAMDAMIQRLEDSIRAIFMNDKLEFQADPNETATVAMARQNEKMRLLGPAVGRMQSEFLGPLIFRVFNIMRRAGELPVMPQQLEEALMAGGPHRNRLKIEYSGPMAIEQRSVEVQAFQRTTGVLAPLIGETDPFHVMDNFDTDDIARWVHDKLGGSAGNLRTVDEVKAIRDQRSAAAQKATGMAEVGAVVDAAEQLGNTDMGPNTALGQLAGATIPQGGLV